MWLIFDIGNSSIKGGIFSGEVLERTFVLPHDIYTLASTLDAELEVASESGMVIDRVGMTSVVPASTRHASDLMRSRNLDVTIVGPGMELPFRMAYRTPETLGTDRIAAAAAAWHRFADGGNRNVIALDAGTAFTYEVVDRNGTYRGGTIAPGPALMQRSLYHETAQLPEVVLELPESPIGRSTTEAMQAGIMYGFIDSARGLLGRIEAMLEGESSVVATGGWSSLLHREIKTVDAVEPHLVLHGTRLLMQLNQ